MLSFPTIAAVEMSAAGGRPVVLHPVEELMAAAARSGFQGIGLDWFTLRDAEARGVDLPRLAELAEELGLTWTDLAALGLDGDGSKDARVSRSMARRCAALSIPVCGLVVSSRPSDAVVARVAASAQIFAAVGVRLALEFLPYSGVRSLAEARDVCARVGYDACGVMIDTLHLLRSGGTATDIVALDAVEIACVQLADGPADPPADLVDESRNARELPGAGAFDLSAFTAGLVSVGYVGTVSIEVLSANLRSLEPDDLAAAYFVAGAAYWSR
jgi:sugar phosphate isomerase/epimerase